MSRTMCACCRTSRRTGAPDPDSGAAPPYSGLMTSSVRTDSFSTGTASTAGQRSADASSVDLSSTSVVVIGAGNMGGAVVTAALAAGVPADQMRIVNSTEESSRRAAEALGATTGTLDDVADADAVIIGVKPYQLGDVLPRVRELLREDALVLCVAAGATLAALREALGGHRELVRAMPNTPMAVGEGVTHLMPSPEANERTVELARALLQASGIVVDLPEDKGHALIGAAGSAPAFVFTVIDAMIDEAVRQGIPRPEATRVVLQSVKGSAALLQETGDHPAVARGKVMSPGGTTAEGVAALERHGVRAAMAAAMDAAAQRSRVMSGE